MPTTFVLPQGTSADFNVQLNNRVDGLPATGFLSTDTLTVLVWPGDNTPVLASPSAAWVNAPLGTLRITFNNADTSDFPAGVYSMEVSASRSGRTAVVANLSLRITARFGTDVTAVGFTTVSDLLLYAPWLKNLQSEEDQTNFAEQQARATLSLVDTLSRAWGKSGGALSLGDPGFMSSSYGGGGSSFWMRQQLIPVRPGSTAPASMPNRRSTAANFYDSRISTVLLVYPEVKEYCARLAISYVCDAQVGSDRDYRSEGRRQRSDALGVFRAGRFEVDLSVPQTGYGVTVTGGSSSLLGG